MFTRDNMSNTPLSLAALDKVSARCQLNVPSIAYPKTTTHAERNEWRRRGNSLFSAFVVVERKITVDEDGNGFDKEGHKWREALALVNETTNPLLSKSRVVLHHCCVRADNPPILSIRTLPPPQPIQHIPRHLLDQPVIIQPIRPIRRTDMKDRPAARKAPHHRVAVRHLGRVFRRGVAKEPDGGKFQITWRVDARPKRRRRFTDRGRNRKQPCR